MAATKNSIQNLFNSPTNPTRLVQPSGGVSIDDAIGAADNNLDQLRLTSSYPNDVQNLTQLLGLAKGLQMLQPYFTNLTMDQVSPFGQTAPDLSTTNSSINALGITDPNYKKILDDLIALLGNGNQSIVCFFSTIVKYQNYFLSIYTVFILF